MPALQSMPQLLTLEDIENMKPTLESVIEDRRLPF